MNGYSTDSVKPMLMAHCKLYLFKAETKMCRALIPGTIFATLIALPFDNIKTRLQYSFSDPTKNRMNYDGMIDCARKVTLV